MSFSEYALLKKAKEFDTTKHEGQKRKFGGQPYIVHPEAVADIITKFQGNTKLQIVAWLHDTLEDTNTSIEELTNEFGAEIINLIIELTTPKSVIKSEKGKYLLDKMNHMSEDALTVKLADRLNNVSDFNIAPDSFVNKYKPETEFILNGLKNLNPIQQKIADEIKKIINTPKKEI